MIQRCINNLIDNSIKYGEKIKLMNRKKNQIYLYQLKMMVPVYQNQNTKMLLKPFYKIDKGRSETKSSVGLGLAISSDIIKSHGGDISFKSQI